MKQPPWPFRKKQKCVSFKCFYLSWMLFQICFQVFLSVIILEELRLNHGSNWSFKALLLPRSKRSLEAECFSHLVLSGGEWACKQKTRKEKKKKTNPRRWEMFIREPWPPGALCEQRCARFTGWCRGPGRDGNTAASSNDPLITYGQIRHARFSTFPPGITVRILIG